MARGLRLATWNINSLRLRLPLLGRLVAEASPDVICLQETKVPDALAPVAAVADLGYAFAAWRGMKGYNGVAILSRLPLTGLDIAPLWCGRDDCRHLAVTLSLPSGPLELHNFYVPAGGDVADPAANPKFAHKLAFLAEARAWFAARTTLARTALVGDLNVAPLAEDVWNHRALLDVVSHTPVETEALAEWLAQGMVDAVRHFVPAPERLYTWWSYRNRDWRRSDRGRRLDHVWVSRDLTSALRRQQVLRQARDWPQTSDHVPVLVELEA
jgi:exodeoxyribonuclease-3